MTTALALAAQWIDVCDYDDLIPERGAAALIDGEQIAIFRLADGSIRAVDNQDPFSGAYVLSRGLVGNAGATPTVASPMLKQRFDLDTGQCLDDASARIDCYAVRRIGAAVQISLSPHTPLSGLGTVGGA